jgi:hypothetical protein
MADYKLSILLDANIDKFKSGLRSAVAETNKAGAAIDKGVSGISNKVTSTFSGIFSVAAIAAFGRAVLNVTSEFQKFNAVLGNTLGSASLAAIKMKEIQDFAAKTPFSVNELTGSFVKLANSGFKPTGDQMRALGDLASSTGKSFDQLAEAILDAQSGEFERLKEFGVRAKDAGDSVIFTYKGVQTQVEKTSESIRNYITNLGNAEGTSGSMAKISQTLGGQISNLGDSWDQMLLSVGSNTSGVFNSAISVIGIAINKITQYNRELAVASKYNIGAQGGFGAQLNRALNPFASKGGTEKELAVAGIEIATDKVSKFVSTTVDGAKSVSDFNKALLELKNRSELALSYANGKGVGATTNFARELDRQKIPRSDPKELEDFTKKLGLIPIKTKNELKAIEDVYQTGVNAIIDARRNFIAAQGAEGGANFGTAKKGEKTAADVMKDLAKQLQVVKNQFGDTFSDINEGKIAAHQSAIDDLINLGVDPASESIKKLQKAQQDLFQLPQIGDISVTATNTKTPALVGQAGKGLFGFDKIKKEQDRIIQQQKEFNDDFTNLVQNGLVDTIGGIGESIGSALASGSNALEAIGTGLLEGFASFISQFGKLLVEYGLAAVGFAKLQASLLIPGAALISGPLAIAAGIALQIAAGAIGSLIGGRSGSGSGVTAFADGGVVYGPTNALIGEYQGARNNPEVVAPLDKLKSLIGNNTFQPILIPIANSKQLAILVKDGNDKLNRQ